VPGEGFGELSLLYNAPRAATIKAVEDSIVWRLDRDTFNHIVKESA
jgi:cAMP-dependent protein kinase regulator